MRGQSTSNVTNAMLGQSRGRAALDGIPSQGDTNERRIGRRPSGRAQTHAAVDSCTAIVACRRSGSRARAAHDDSPSDPAIREDRRLNETQPGVGQ